MSKKLKKALKHIEALEEHISFISEELRAYKIPNSKNKCNFFEVS